MNHAAKMIVASVFSQVLWTWRRLRLRRRGSCSAVLLLLGAEALLLRAAENSREQFEEQAVQRYAERWHKQSTSPRARWYREMQAAFAGKAVNPQKEEDFQQWFELLAGGAEQWRRSQAPTPQLAELFDQVCQRLELGPVPSVNREEFLRYVRRVLWRDGGRAEDLPDMDSEADRVFRVLDQDADGVLDVTEMTTALRQQRSSTDVDGNGRIDRTEYRRYFLQRVTAVTQSLQAKAGAGSEREGKAASAPLVPPWFREWDRDEDGQLALHEWLKAGQPLELFQQMDGDGDHLLTLAEYLRSTRAPNKSAGEGLPLPLTGGIKKEPPLPAGPGRPPGSLKP
ncbi:MAG: EF-hand domain-containing protein [Thermogemmata sp.]|jgi:Ca2+-binding EF-hand superfamily protein|nr:EF-hand domain-containing protein [Gemmataceae bacterium]